MKALMISALAAVAVTMSAGAHAADRTTALSADQMRVELALVTKELSKVEASMIEIVRRQHARSLMTPTELRVNSSNGAETPAFASKSSQRELDRSLARFASLSDRRDELRAEMKKAGAFTADEIRAQIQEIDTKLVRYRQVSMLSGAAQTNFTRSSMQYSTLSTPSDLTYYPVWSDVGSQTPVMSTGPRASAWRTGYRLAEERKELYATLQALENSQD